MFFILNIYRIDNSLNWVIKMNSKRAWGCQKCEQTWGESRIQGFSGSVKSVEFREER